MVIRTKVKRKRKRKHIEDITLATYVAISLGMIVLYTVAEMVTATLTGISHDTLTTCFTAVFGGEVVTAGLIKIYKLKEEDGDNDK